MPEQKSVTVYTFDELSGTAKETARDWMRREQAEDFDTDYLFDDFIRIAGIIGIAFDTHGLKLLGGSIRQSPRIWWTLHTQGSGACFDGSYQYARGSTKAIRREAPNDETLHQIADDLAATQKTRLYRLTASVTAKGRYTHARSTDIEVFDSITGNEADPGLGWTMNGGKDLDTDSVTENVREALRAFMNWMYSQLQAEYDHRLADECIDETLRTNGYNFTAHGTRSITR